MREWANSEVKEIDDAIDTYNSSEAKRKERTTKFKNGELPKSDFQNETVRDAKHGAAIELDRTELVEQSKWTSAHWAKRRKVPLITSNSTGSDYLLVTKFALELHYRSQSSLASRYSKVIEWIATTFAADLPHSAQEIADAINGAGGFDAVIEVSRGKKGNGPTEEEVILTGKALVKMTRAALASTAPLAVVPPSQLVVPNGLVALLARKDDEQLAIVGTLRLEEQQFDRALSNYPSESLLPANPRAELLWRVLQLANLVRVGERTDKKRGDLESGIKERSVRTLWIGPDDTSGVVFGVSARFADASIVVTVRPIAGHFASLSEVLALDGKAIDDVSARLSSRAHCHVIDIDTENDGASWVLTNAVLSSAGKPEARFPLPLQPVEDFLHKPLEVVGFRCTAICKLSLPVLADWYEARLKDWGGEGKVSEKLATLKIGQAGLTYVFNDASTELLCTINVTGEHAMMFRPRDLHDVVRAIMTAAPSQCEISLDVGGLAQFAWSDQVGRYEVNLPTASDSGGLIHRRVEPMHLTASVE